MLGLRLRIQLNRDLQVISSMLYKHNKYKNSNFCTKALFESSNFISSCATNLVRKFSVSSTLSSVLYKDTENSYAYNVLQTIPVFSKDLLAVRNPKEVITTSNGFNGLLDQEWRSKSATEIVEAFKSALDYCVQNNIKISDQRFDKLVDGLMDRVQDLTDNELLEMLHCLMHYPSCETYTEHNYHDIWSALDDLCCWKLPHLPIETKFALADCWYHLKLGKVGKYTRHFVERMSKMPEQLTKVQLLHIFFYINVCRKHSVNFHYENILQKHISMLTADQLAIISMGFFKSQSRITFKFLLGSIIEQTKKESSSVHEISLTAILKVLRYSCHVLQIDQLLDLLDHVTLEIGRLSNLCCMHIALTGTTQQFFHEKSLRQISHKVIKYIDDTDKMRIKDMERLLLALTMFDYNPETDPDIFQTIFKELHRDVRRREFVKYRRCLPSILHLLSMRRLYSHELMNELLDKDCILEEYGKNPRQLQQDILSLDVCIEIECPDYKGNRLDKLYRQKACMWQVEYTPEWDQPKKLTVADRFMLEVRDTIEKIVGGRENLHCEHLLPNYVKSDIIICKDENGRFVQPTGFGDYKLGDVMRAPNLNWKWYAFVPLGGNSVVKNTLKPVGLIIMKVRQLRAIGYEPVLVSTHEFTSLQGKEKIDYIRNKIN